MTVALEKLFLENDTRDGWPSLVDMKVILPGLVHYEDLKNTAGEVVGGTVLIKKEAFDRMAPSLEGKPIINWDHRTVDPKDFSKGRVQGIIISPAFFNAGDGWYHAKGLVWDEQTKKNIKDGFSISCAYVPTEFDTKPGFHNKVPYHAEVLNGEYTHIAVVDSPRYEGARIELLNSTGGKIMGLLNFFKKDKSEEKLEIDLEKTSVDGVPLSEMINSFKAKAAQTPVELKDEDLVEVDGRKVTVAELKNAHKEQLENAVKVSHEKGDHKQFLDSCGLCADEKKKQELANSADAKEKEQKEIELKNAAEKKEKEEAEKRSLELSQRRNKGGQVEMPKIQTIQDLVKQGEERYG